MIKRGSGRWGARKRGARRAVRALAACALAACALACAGCAQATVGDDSPRVVDVQLLSMHKNIFEHDKDGRVAGAYESFTRQ